MFVMAIRRVRKLLRHFAGRTRVGEKATKTYAVIYWVAGCWGSSPREQEDSSTVVPGPQLWSRFKCRTNIRWFL